ncbi:MAG: amino acid ABC transporter permease [Gammaproteobacteria bacterium]|nr:amino acid ABC transporter permease [Gammaproteobacteria bacterium]MBU1442306.1 amino acid ABC transporter permease [Gammaproteobacteria bacterium]MBU2285618.1 amino acid ABC transporter permease [Gammaproteobacteria bacterium]MBU2409190.1 amino acid ABC transporter permease [Gammaproteobacteria bacterium]
MERFIRTSLVDARTAPRVVLPATTRWRRTWFSSPAAGVLLIVAAVVVLPLGWRFVQWAIVDAHWLGESSAACPDSRGACWAFVIARWKPWLVGGYPSDQLWRPMTCFAVFAVFWLWATLRSRTASLQGVLLGFLVLPPAFMLLLLGGGGVLPVVTPDRWGGLLLTLVATLATFATAIPLGLALALGRRSTLPLLRWLCAGFVEGMRSVPLLVVLFIAATLLPMFLPNDMKPDLFARALAAFVLFNAAMAAEVFRGGLQRVGRGQIEAATTVGLGRLAVLALIVLPQAVRAVVPALVNIMIAVIKETTLLSVIGVNDFLGAVENGAKSPDWSGESNILTSGHVFLALSYFAVCFALSHYSRRLEARH